MGERRRERGSRVEHQVIVGGQGATSAPSLSFSERKAAREAARAAEVARVQEAAKERKRAMRGFIDWMNAETKCDWCGIVAPRHDFAYLDRDEAKEPVSEDDGLYNSCQKCSDEHDAHEEQRHTEEAISRGEYDDYDYHLPILTDEQN